MTQIPVIFRADRSGPHKGEVTAVFPSLESNYGHCVCYAHIGQHGECAMGWYMETRAATPDEYVDLLAELRRIYERNGDTLRVMKRIPYRAWSKRV